MGQYAMSERHACRLVKLARSTHRYQSRRVERDAALGVRLQELAAKRMRFGYRRLTAMLVREGVEVKSQTGLSIVSGGRLGDAHTAAKADPMEGDGDQAGGDQAESTVVDGLCERLCK